MLDVDRNTATATARSPRLVPQERAAKPNLLFVVGIMGRVGTNYLARLLVAHPQVCRPRGHWELPLLDAADEFAAFHARFCSRRAPGRLDYSFDEFAECFGRGLFDLLVERADGADESARYLLQKNPATLGLERFRAFFPDAKVLLLVRDGRDNVNSLLRAAGFGECRWWNLRRIAYLVQFSRKWARSARRMLAFLDADDDCLLVRYEEVHGSPEALLTRVAEFAGLAAPAEWLNGSRDLPVTGSGFLSATGDPSAAEPGRTNWEVVPKTQAFQPVGRWRSSWSRIDLAIFDAIAGREMERLGYGEPVTR